MEMSSSVQISLWLMLLQFYSILTTLCFPSPSPRQEQVMKLKMGYDHFPFSYNFPYLISVKWYKKQIAIYSFYIPKTSVHIFLLKNWSASCRVMWLHYKTLLTHENMQKAYLNCNPYVVLVLPSYIHTCAHTHMQVHHVHIQIKYKTNTKLSKTCETNRQKLNIKVSELTTLKWCCTLADIGYMPSGVLYLI